jgi:hypothetical protein
LLPINLTSNVALWAHLALEHDMLTCKCSFNCQATSSADAFFQHKVVCSSIPPPPCYLCFLTNYGSFSGVKILPSMSIFDRNTTSAKPYEF